LEGLVVLIEVQLIDQFAPVGRPSVLRVPIMLTVMALIAPAVLRAFQTHIVAFAVFL